MYSVILMAAMTAPAETPSWGHLFNRGDCCGCSGYSCGGCGGYSCGGCRGYSCGGCGGYSCGGCWGAHYYNYGCCGGCWGGCWGGSWNGCCGGCWGTGGFRTHFTCHGAGACWGYAYAGVGYGFAGCYGSCYGSVNYFAYPAPAYAYPTCAPYGPPAQGAPPAAAPDKPMNDGRGEPKPLAPGAPKGDGKVDTAAPADVVVTLPADAVLYANGVRTAQTSGERHFVTPNLNPGQSYHYVFTAEINRNNQPVTETYQVEVRAGAETRVNFAQLISASPPDASRIARK